MLARRWGNLAKPSQIHYYTSRHLYPARYWKKTKKGLLIKKRHINLLSTMMNNTQVKITIARHKPKKCSFNSPRTTVAAARVIPSNTAKRKIAISVAANTRCDHKRKREGWLQKEKRKTHKPALQQNGWHPGASP